VSQREAFISPRIDDYPEDLAEGDDELQETDVQRASPSRALSVPRTTPDHVSSSSSESSTASTSSSPSISSPQPQPKPLPSLVLPHHPVNAELMDKCRSFLDRLQRGTAPWVVQRLRSTYGSIPTDPASFSFWVGFILPIDEREKAKLLPIRSPRLRLLLVVHWIEQLNNNWYTERNLIYGTVSLIVLLFAFFFGVVRGVV
jgi:hypothetical protein